MPKKTSYFSHDSNARNDEKILAVRMRHNAEGYGIYFMIVERLRDESDYMSVKDYNVIAFDLRVDASKVKSIVEDFGLFVFTDDGKYFYSESLLSRMEMKDESSKKRSEAGKKGMEKRWNNKNDNIVKPIDNNVITNDKIPITSKVKESKEKEEKEIIKKNYRFLPPSLEDIENYFSEKIKENKLSMNAKNEAVKFEAFYSSKNWFVGKNKMTNWKKAVGGWIARSKPFEQQKSIAYSKPDYSNKFK